VEGKVDGEGRLAGAPVAVEDERASGGEDRVVVVAEQGSGGGLVDGGELVDRGDDERERNVVLGCVLALEGRAEIVLVHDLEALVGLHAALSCR
jgi:hypothetical protein